MFQTSFSFLTKVANFKQNDSCAECFDANFEQQDSCARCFAKIFAFKQKSPISSKTTVAHSVLTLISSNRKVAHGVFDKLEQRDEKKFFSDVLARKEALKDCENRKIRIFAKG